MTNSMAYYYGLFMGVFVYSLAGLVMTVFMGPHPVIIFAFLFAGIIRGMDMGLKLEREKKEVKHERRS